MTAKKVLTIGGATKDIFLHFEDIDLLENVQNNISKKYLLFQEGSKIDVKNITNHSGGGATNTAVSFKRLGLNVSTIFKIGQDNEANFILEDLKKENLNLHVSYSTVLPSAVSFVLPTKTDRVILAYRGANVDLKKDDINFDSIKQNDLIYITSLSGQSSKMLFPITQFAKENNIKIAVNPGMSQLSESNILKFSESLKNINILILNAKEAEELFLNLIKINKIESITNIKDNLQLPKLLQTFTVYNDQHYSINEYFKLIFSYGIKIVIVTNGAEGVYVGQGEDIYFHGAIKPEKIINTLGAGDAFASTFVGCLLLEKLIDESLFLGILNASSVISCEGAKTGLLTLEQLEEKSKKFINQTKKFQIG